MGGRLFLVRGEESVVNLQSASFADEDTFQRLMERFPQLLTELDGSESRRWILIKREAGVPDSDYGFDRWSLDHLFLDDEAVPTLVEIKRASDTRSRREVVAQLLEYAANARRWWSVDRLMDWHTKGASDDEGDDPAARLAKALGKDSLDYDAYWRSVESNLSAGRLRLVIVADIISPELERIVEFLNEQMTPASVLALELKVFASGSERILSPRLIGLTRRAEDVKGPREGYFGSVDEWLAARDADERVRAFTEHMRQMGAVPTVAGKKLAFDVGLARIAYIGSGKVYLSLWMLRKTSVFESDTARQGLLDCFKARGFIPPTNKLLGEPYFSIPAQSDTTRWASLLALFDDLIKQLQ